MDIDPRQSKAPLHAPSGRYYVTALASYPRRIPKALEGAVLKARPGDLIELLACRQDWGIGVELVRYQDSNWHIPGARGKEGAFNLDWVRGLKICIDEFDGKSCTVTRVELDVRSDAYGYSPAVPEDARGRQQLQERQLSLQRIAAQWAMETSKMFEAREKARLGLGATEPSCHPDSMPHSADYQRSIRGKEPPEASGEEEESPTSLRRAIGRKKPTLAKRLASARRSGELHALVKEFVTAQTEISSSASNLKALKEKVKTIMLGAHRRGELRSLAGELAQEVKRKADDFQLLKERVLRRILELKRAGDLERLAQEMAGSDALAEETGAQPLLSAKERALRSLLEMKRSGELERLAQGMADAHEMLKVKAEELAAQLEDDVDDDQQRSGELERIFNETTEMLEHEAATIKEKLKNGLLRAHRTGALAELAGELNELADVVPQLEARTVPKRPHAKAQSRRWSEMTTSSDSDFDPRATSGRRAAGLQGSRLSSYRTLGQTRSQASGDCSSDTMSDSQSDVQTGG